MRVLPIASAIAIVATTAIARPKHDEIGGRVSYVVPKSEPTPRSDGRWVELAAATSVRHGTEFITVGPEAGRFSQLRVDAHAGTVILLQVRVFDDSGTVQSVSLGRTLDRMHKSALIDLTTWKAIDQIAVTTDPHTDGKYMVYGSSREASIAAR